MERNSLLLIFAIFAGAMVFTVGLGQTLDSIIDAVIVSKLVFGLIALCAGMAITTVSYRQYRKQHS